MEAILARSVQVLIALGGAYLVALWFALVVWTFQDIQMRSRSVIAQIFSTLVAVLFFVPGVLLYLLLRPKDTLDDAFQRSLEEEYLLQDLEELPLCYNCQRYVNEDFVYCPHCSVELRQDCTGCGQLIDLRWDVCPYCGTEQYPDEPATPVEEPAAWDRLPAGGVSHFDPGTRERLAPQPSRTSSRTFGASEVTTPISSGDDDLDATSHWAPVETPASDAWKRSSSNGASAYPSRWDDLPQDNYDGQSGEIDEFPKKNPRRKP